MNWYETIFKDQVKEDLYSIPDTFLRWKEDTSNKGNYFLKKGNNIIGSLRFSGKKGKYAAGNINGTDIIVKTKGVINKSVVISELKSGDTITARLKNIEKEEEVSFKNRILNWKLLNKYSNEWSFEEGDNSLLVFKPLSSFYHTGYFAEIKDNSIDKNLLNQLLVLGLFNLYSFTEELSFEASLIM